MIDRHEQTDRQKPRPVRPEVAAGAIILTICAALCLLSSQFPTGSDSREALDTSDYDTTPIATPPTASRPITPPSSVPAPTTTPARKIASWSGSGIKNTALFTVDSSSWKIRWAARMSDNGGVFQVFVNDEKGNPIALAGNVTRTGTDETYVHQSGKFYLEMNTSGCDWVVEVWTTDQGQ